MDFSKLSSDNLNEFVSIEYGIPTDETLPLEDQANQLFTQLKTTNVEFPYPVVDLFLATNYLGPRDKTYTYDQIMNLSKEEIKPFLDLFNVPPSPILRLNRERIYRILTYLDLIRLEDDLIQPHILDYLCETLSLDDLNNYRIANGLDQIKCPFQVKSKYRDKYRFSELNDKTYRWANIIVNRGPDALYGEFKKTNDISDFRYFLNISKFYNYSNTFKPYNVEFAQALLDFNHISLSDLLFEAIRNQDIDSVNLAIQNGADLNPGIEIITRPMHLAVVKDNLEIIKLLIENGTNINDRNFFGHTPLMLAVAEGHFNLVKYFIEMGVDPNIQTKSSGSVNTSPTALDTLIHNREKIGNEKFKEIKKYLEDHGAKTGEEVYFDSFYLT